MSESIGDQEREAGSFVMVFGFGSHAVKGKTLSQIFADDPECLVEMVAWRGFKKWPDWLRAKIEAFMACERIAAIAATIKPKVRGKKAAKFKAKAVDRQHQADLFDRQTEYGVN